MARALTCAAALVALAPDSTLSQFPSTIFPRPLEIEIDGERESCLTLAPDMTIGFSFSSPGGNTSGPVLAAAIRRTQAQMLPCAAPTAAACAAAVTQLDVAVAAGDSPLAAGVDESYNLTVGAGHATLTAATVWGGLHGLQTFSQLFSDQACRCEARGVRISDGPRFGWRGMMVDSGRQFIPLPLIFATVDAMSYAKMNVMHWHLTDDEYFSVESAAYPQLAQKAAGVPGRVYSHADLAAVVKYAAARGVRVGLGRIVALYHCSSTIYRNC
jgi:hexosaminidase